MLSMYQLNMHMYMYVIPLSLFLMLDIGPNSYTYAHVHVHNIGIIIGVNEDDAFSWPVCSHCHGDQLAESADNPG